MDFDAKITGLAELETLMLKELPAATSRKVMLSSLRRASDPILQQAEQKVPKRSHALGTALGMKVVPERLLANNAQRKAFAALTISPLNPDFLAYAMWLAHYRGGKLSANARVGQISYGHLVEFGYRLKDGTHVGAQPFLRPAFDNAAPGTLGRFTADLGKSVKRVLKRRGVNR